MKNTIRLFATFSLLTVAAISNANTQTEAGQVTAVTACGNEYTFEGSSVSVKSSSINGVTISEVYVDDQLVKVETCGGGSGSSSGSSSSSSSSSSN